MKSGYDLVAVPQPSVSTEFVAWSLIRSQPKLANLQHQSTVSSIYHLTSSGRFCENGVL